MFANWTLFIVFEFDTKDSLFYENIRFTVYYLLPLSNNYLCNLT